MFCRHKWEVLSTEVTQSKFESSVLAVSGVGKETVNLPHQLCDADRKHIQIVTCSKCGKLKRFVEEI